MLIVANSQAINSFNAIREVLYNPYVEALGVFNLQFGVLMPHASFAILPPFFILVGVSLAGILMTMLFGRGIVKRPCAGVPAPAATHRGSGRLVYRGQLCLLSAEGPSIG